MKTFEITVELDGNVKQVQVVNAPNEQALELFLSGYRLHEVMTAGAKKINRQQNGIAAVLDKEGNIDWKDRKSPLAHLINKTAPRRKAKKIQIVVDCYQGNEEPVLATFDEAKAWKAYYDIIREGSDTVDDSETAPAQEGTEDVIRLDGQCYQFVDQYGSAAARIFELDVE